MANFEFGLDDRTVVQPLLTDLYQIRMAYSYWKSGKMNDYAVFDLYFRKNPFNGEYTIFAGLEQCLHFLKNFHFSKSDIEYLKTVLGATEEGFFEYLENLNAADITVHAIDEGSVVFPRVPLITIEGPLIVAQLIETTFLTLVNYASLMATNATRYRIAAGDNVGLIEMGLRRAQGPNGGLSASKYSYVGGFDGTSNLLAGKMFNIPVEGTQAHAYVSSFTNMSELQTRQLTDRNTGEMIDLLKLTSEWRSKISRLLNCSEEEASDGELTAFTSFAISFPNTFVALIDTYDVAKSGLLNFCSVALALNDLGYKPVGVRIDSGDLAYFSVLCRSIFVKIAVQYNLPWFAKLKIIASSDVNEDTIWSLNEQNHKIDCFGVGTHLVTCQKQPALGCVYKLVEINGKPRIKLSQDVAKMTMPGRKIAYRLYGCDGFALCDILQRPEEEVPKIQSKVLCRHPFDVQKRAFATPSQIDELQKVYWSNGKICQKLPLLTEIRDHVKSSLKALRQDHKRNLNPTPYKVSVSDYMYNFINELWLQNAPIGDLK